MLDEPSLGLSPQAMKMVFDAIRELTAFGLSESWSSKTPDRGWSAVTTEW